MERYEGIAKLILQHGANADARDKNSLRMKSLRIDSLRTNAPLQSEAILSSTCTQLILTCMIVG